MSRLYCMREAQVCMSLARNTDDPTLKERYEDLARKFLQRGVAEDDAEFDFAPSTNRKIKPGSSGRTDSRFSKKSS